MAELTPNLTPPDCIPGNQSSLKYSEAKQANNSASTSSLNLCPKCSSKKLWRDGNRYSLFGDKIQRWLCRECGLRFSDPQDVQKAHNTIERIETIEAKSLKSWGDKVTTRQICVSETKNLVAEQQIVEVPRRNEVDIKGKIVEYMWRLKREAYHEETIAAYGYKLEILVKRGANLFDPESVKKVIADQSTWNPDVKNNAVKAYRLFINFEGIQAILPKYKGPKKLPFIPAEEEIDQLIAGCGHQMATFLQLLKETAARYEAFNLKWIDLDIRNSTVTITPEKGSNPRIFKISSSLLTMLLTFPRTSQQIFTYKSKYYAGKTFRKMRQRIAHKLGNPRLLKIHFHTLRHWKATDEYRKTRDILHVMQLLGHRSINNTLIYIQLSNVGQGDDYVCKVAKTLQEATQLIEGGYEYVTDMDGYKLFRKRK